MQSSFKSQPPSFIDEIQRDLRATAMHVDHVIFMGYSLPLDDVTYRAFFSARCQNRPKDRPVRCTIVTKDASNPDWYAPTTLETRRFEPPTDKIVDAAKDIFGNGNVRLYGGGIPEVFLDAWRKVTREKVIGLAATELLHDVKRDRVVAGLANDEGTLVIINKRID